ncbi:hypothetical protein CCO03_07915 [Comamonas serinivorans]|uniref:Carboxypeptidase regulatory-like domain-containing protein n=1 Tax=Comamonas serinivorans TaxID=1082851 RepID=A0A1Y0ELV8_9BURK|nr:hypothetical protein [Comamonas serinivorans]ARU04607.1 hypothetical protein CCO03_07915 [Comamonas serinivorans]
MNPNPHRLSQKALLASSVLAILLGTPPWVRAAPHAGPAAHPASAGSAVGALPPEQVQGGVRYLSGGIGTDESRALREAAKDWPLTLAFAVRDGEAHAFAVDVRVRIADAQGQPVLTITAQGPLLLAQLRPGRYTVTATFEGNTVTATFEGNTVTRQVHLQAGQPVHETLLWTPGVTAAKP